MLLNDAECYWLSLGRINDQWSWQSSPSYADYVISMIIISKYDQYADCVAAARAAPCSVSSHRLPQVPQVLVGLTKNGDLENEGNLLLIELMMFQRIMMIWWTIVLEILVTATSLKMLNCAPKLLFAIWLKPAVSVLSSYPEGKSTWLGKKWLAVKSNLDNGVGLQRLPTFKDPRSGRYWAREEKQEMVKMHPEKWSRNGICYKGSIFKNRDVLRI